MARGNNEGCITQRKDGRWEARITVGYRGTKQLRKCIYGKTRQDVADKMSAALALTRKGQELPNEKLTVEAFLTQWLEGAAKAKLRARTHQRYTELMKLHIIPDLGRYPVARLSPQQVQNQLAKISKPLSARTVVQVRAVLRSALNQALRFGIVTRNAAALASPPKTERYEAVFLTDEQAMTLLKQVKGHRLEALITLALTTGLRMGEMLGLSWSDIDLTTARVTIRRQQQVIGGETVLLDTKTRKSERVLDLPTMTVAALEKHRNRQLREDCKAAGDKWQWSGRVFCDEHGRPP